MAVLTVIAQTSAHIIAQTSAHTTEEGSAHAIEVAVRAIGFLVERCRRQAREVDAGQQPREEVRRVDLPHAPAEVHHA